MELRERLQASIGKEYEVGSELGGGVQSRVYAARDTELDRPVVIKVLPPELAAGEGLERFRREIRLVAGLQHPHIVPLLVAGEADGLLYYTMPLVTGESLRAVLDREGPQSIEFVATVMAEVASALVYAHGRNIVHRDVKPGNIFVEAESGRILLADFGVARRIGFEGTVTASGVAIGTPAYMSPESLDGGPVDGRSDIFSLGLVAWELLVGERPWQSETLYSLIYSQKCEPTPSLVDRRPDVPNRLRKAIEGCLKKDPDERWTSADVLLGFLCDTAADEPRLVRRRASAAGNPAAERPAPSFKPRAPRTLSAGRLEVRWNGDLPVVIPPRLTQSGRRLWAPVAALAAALVLAVGLRWAQVSSRPPVVSEAHGDVPSLPAVAAVTDDAESAPVAAAPASQVAAVVPVAERRATSQLDRVYASLVIALRARGGEPAVRELQRAEAMWENGRHRSCARQESDGAHERCESRLATLRAQELTELLERSRAR
ncbi:MAG TPA: serine/threonine-protein kinase [Gemmatimonadaceae bacterium]|nr:serine/threonine-protein kinase [Gemmatimonadaceae bacterium]